MNAKLFLKKHSSTILTCVGIFGVVATAVTAVKATPRALELIKNEKDRQNYELVKAARDAGEESCIQIDKLHLLDIVRVTWKCYIPATLVGMSTIACILGANILNKRSQAALVSAYSLLNSSFKEYREHANDIYGEDADKKIREAIAKDQYSKLPFKVDEEKQLFWDMMSNRYFESTLTDIYRAEYELNRTYAKYGYVCLNDFYMLAGADPVEGGYDVGWSIDASNMFYGYDCIDFEHEFVLLEDGLECYIIIMPHPPTADYLC